MSKIVSVVVTYNRKELLLRNLKHQLTQTYPFYKIIIIDNYSTDGTHAYLNDAGILNDERVIYMCLDENRGGAGGFEFGVNEAFKSGADYVLLMDDDGYMIDENTLANLIVKVPANNKLIMMNSLVLCDEENLSFGLGASLLTKTLCREAQEDGLIKDYINPFNGTLISKELYLGIGAPNGRFFIRGDEQEYQLRAKEFGAFIATAVDSLYMHPSGKKEIKKFLGKDFVNSYDAPWKEYYEMRNMTYAVRKQSKSLAYKRYLSRIIGLYLFKVPQRKNIKRFIKIGYRHGKKGILGKTVAPGQKKI